MYVVTHLTLNRFVMRITTGRNILLIHQEMDQTLKVVRI